MRTASKVGAAVRIIQGEEELKNGTVCCKYMRTGEQAVCPRSALAAFVERYDFSEDDNQDG